VGRVREVGGGEREAGFEVFILGGGRRLCRRIVRVEGQVGSLERGVGFGERMRGVE